MDRSFPIVLVCILLILSGLIGIIIGAVLVIGGGFLSGFLEEIEVGLEEQLAVLGIYGIGLLSLIWGGLEIAASYGLWKLRKWGAYLAIGLSCLAIIVSISLWNILSIADILFSILVIILVGLGWNKLAPQKIPVGE